MLGRFPAIQPATPENIRRRGGHTADAANGRASSQAAAASPDDERTDRAHAAQFLFNWLIAMSRVAVVLATVSAVLRNELQSNPSWSSGSAGT